MSCCERHPIRRQMIERLGSLVHEPALAGLSDIDKSYLLKMAQDDGPSSTTEIAARLNADMRYKRLLFEVSFGLVTGLPSGMIEHVA